MDSKGTHFVFDVALFYHTFIGSHSPAVNCRDDPNAEVTSRQFAFKQAETTEPLPAATASLLYLTLENLHSYSSRVFAQLWGSALATRVRRCGGGVAHLRPADRIP